MYPNISSFFSSISMEDFILLIADDAGQTHTEKSYKGKNLVKERKKRFGAKERIVAAGCGTLSSSLIIKFTLL